MENTVYKENDVLLSDKEEHHNYLMHLQTVQSTSFRVLIEALKEILTDVNLEFDEKGIRIVAMDISHTVLVHVRLQAENFEEYYCPKRIVIGLSMLNFYKLIKTTGNNDTLKIYVEKDDSNRLGIQIHNSEKQTLTKYKINLMDLPDELINIPPVVFDSVITMSSSHFQKICRDMNNLSDHIEIKCCGQHLIFSCKGEFATQETHINKGQDLVKSPSEIIQGVFLLKYLVLFTKCTNLCNTIEMYLKNDYPLIITYACANLGIIKLCLAPQVT
jgi:proliferating cell nuclear antigen